MKNEPSTGSLFMARARSESWRRPPGSSMGGSRWAETKGCEEQLGSAPPSAVLASREALSRLKIQSIFNSSIRVADKVLFKAANPEQL